MRYCTFSSSTFQNLCFHPIESEKERKPPVLIISRNGFVFSVSFFCAEVLSMSPKRRFLFENRRTTRRQRSPPPPGSKSKKKVGMPASHRDRPASRLSDHPEAALDVTIALPLTVRGVGRFRIEQVSQHLESPFSGEARRSPHCPHSLELARILPRS